MKLNVGFLDPHTGLWCFLGDGSEHCTHATSCIRLCNASTWKRHDIRWVVVWIGISTTCQATQVSSSARIGNVDDSLSSFDSRPTANHFDSRGCSFMLGKHDMRACVEMDVVSRFKLEFMVKILKFVSDGPSEEAFWTAKQECPGTVAEKGFTTT